MFDDISPKYDFLNHFLSFGIDHLWRKRLVALLKGPRPARILDVACGTGDLAIALTSLGTEKIIGIDISEKMLEIGRKKAAAKGLQDMISFHLADAEEIPFPDHSFNAVTVAFGVRNFGDLQQGLKEMGRVLAPGGNLMILEFSHPEFFPVRQLYAAYSRFVIPVAGRIISGNTAAYAYLPESVAAFPSGERFTGLLRETGFRNISRVRLSAGIASIYRSEK